MVILFFADIFGKPGRKAIAAALPELKERYQPDFIVGNAENIAGGRGVNRKSFNQMIDLGFSGFTSGNHIWDNKEVLQIMESDHRLIRPANYPSPRQWPCPGRGYTTLHENGKSLFLINVLGRVFMDALDDPFAAVDRILEQQKPACPVLVDMHADATSEKYAMGWHLAGRVAAVVGSHTHVQTADEHILPGGTAYITDVGMTGAFHSVIGLKPPEIVRKFMTKRSAPYLPATESPGISCVVITLGESGKAEKIERIRRVVEIGADEEDEA